MSTSPIPAPVRQLLSEAAAFRLLALLFSRPRAGFADEARGLAGEAGDGALARAAEALAQADEGPYHAVLGPGGAASGREAGHLGLGDPGRALSALAASYQAFGFAPAREEPADHVAVECDFAAWLHLKEAFALLRHDAEAAEVTRAERNRFLSVHLGPLGHGIAARLPEGSPPHLVAAAGALARRLPPPAGPPPLPVLGEDEDPLAGGCPMAGEA
ncbi:MAG TPA: molecular chaperone TorD family protein [Anaeromyxobacteraceae bacterium]|nr:molecular chaperone TorD family protein [Anaeromyxobacteraceae bacterium]